MRLVGLVAISAILVAGCDKQPVQDLKFDPATVDLSKSSFTPGEVENPNPPELALRMRAIASEMRDDGLGLAIAERSSRDRTAWLLYDPRLEPTYWIVSEGGNLPADKILLRSQLAYLRATTDGPFVVGFDREGRLIDEPTGRHLARPVFISPEGQDALVALAVEKPEAAAWDRKELPVIGPVRYQRIE